MGNESSNRRRFIRKLAKLGAVSGIAMLLLERLGGKPLIPPVQAVDMVIDAANYGTGTTELQSSTSGAAFKARATSTSAYNYGVYGQSDSYNGVGVQGSAVGGNSVGVKGVSDYYGVVGQASASSGYTYGVYGVSLSSSGKGVYGYASAASGSTVGVWGESGSSSGIGVEGYASSAGAKPIVARGYFGQTANLQEWQNNAGTALSVVDAAGKLGVGISTPARQVHLQGNNAVFRMDRDANSSAFILVRTAAGDFGTIWKTFYVGVDASGVNNGSFFIGDVGTAVSGPSTKRLLIDNAGNVGVGTETPGYKLDVAGAAHASSFPTSSDIRFKDDVAPLANVLERLDQVRGVSFTWNDLYTSLGRATKGRQIGVIAQEVEKAFPELVSYWSADGVDDCRAVDYGRFSAVLLEAVKELYEQVKELREQIARLPTDKAN